MQSATSSALFIGAVIITVFYGFALVIYRVLWHPLARFPGPKFAAATKWYEAYYDLLHDQGGAFVYEVDRMHEKYGPVVRVNPDELHIRDSSYFRKLYAGAGARRDKYEVAANMLDAPLGLFGTVKHELHRPRRMAISPFFSKATVLQREDLSRGHVERLYQLLCRQDVSECHACFLALATDIISSYAFDRTMGLLENMPAALDWQKTLKAVESLTPLSKQFTWIIPTAKRLPRWLIRLAHPSISRLLDVHDEMRDRAEVFVAEELEKKDNIIQKDETPSRGRQIPQAIFDSDLPPEEKSVGRIAQESFTVLVAGGDTVAWALSVAVFHLLSNPDTLASLQQELATVHPRACSELPRLSELENLPWLNAVLKESLRIWGVATSRFPVVCPEEDLVYGETVLPRNTPISMTIRDLLHDPAVYKDPLTFQPERWLPGPDLAEHEKNFVSFGKGNRICLGLNLAWAEMYLVLAMLVRRFDMELVDVVRDRDVDTVRDCFIGVPSRSQKGVNVRFTPKAQST